jgi:LPXTG-site transpeptidase (sortase) family protein
MFGGHSTVSIFARILAKPWTFLAVFLAVFFVTCVVLFALDFYPEPETGSADETQTEDADDADEAVTMQLPVENPTRIVISAIGVDTVIENPASTDIGTLDQALLKGAVRYPASALLGENARMFIFGHQSKLPVVKNKAFKAFNDLQNLKGGEEIVVYSSTAVYRYRVKLVEHKSAEDAWIELGYGARELILTTCDSFGKKTDRYVVTAEFVSREALEQTQNI